MFWKKENTEMKKHDKTVLLFVFSKKKYEWQDVIVRCFSQKKTTEEQIATQLFFEKEKNEKQILLFASVAGYTPSLVENDK